MILGSVNIRMGKFSSDHPISHIRPIHMNSEAPAHVIVTKSYSDIIGSFTVMILIVIIVLKVIYCIQSSSTRNNLKCDSQEQ